MNKLIKIMEINSWLDTLHRDNDRFLPLFSRILLYLNSLNDSQLDKNKRILKNMTKKKLFNKTIAKNKRIITIEEIILTSNLSLSITAKPSFSVNVIF